MKNWLEHTKKLRAEGSFEKTMDFLNDVLNDQPNDPLVHYQIAWTHDALGKESDAAPAYEKAISLGLSGENLEGAYLGLGSPHTSESARKFVGQLFSQTPLPTHSDGVPNKNDLFKCRDSDGNDKSSTYSYAFNDGKSGNLSMVFNSIFGSHAIYQLRADFKNISREQLTNATGEAFFAESNLDSVGSGHSTEFTIRLSRQKDASPVFELSYMGGGKPMLIGSQTLHCEKF